jgi:RNA polymerase sigma-70 factor (ECF subfamily)
MDPTEQFQEIVCQHYESLFRFALSLTGAQCDAQDLTQQTFYIWAKKGHQLRDASKVKTWLFTTLHRGFLVARRKQSRFPHHDLEEVPEQFTVDTAEVPEPLDSAAVLRALRKVDEVHQGAVALYYLEDCSYKEIAIILDVPLGTVRSRIARGIAQLRRILAVEGPKMWRAITEEPLLVEPAPSKTGPPACGQRRQRPESSGTIYLDWDLRSIDLPGTISP